MGNRQNLPHSQLTETKLKNKTTHLQKNHQPLLQKKLYAVDLRFVHRLADDAIEVDAVMSGSCVLSGHF
mgnify:CR=1 FL=1|jgi:hypothetical protein